jgi:hypothetical protein
VLPPVPAGIGTVLDLDLVLGPLDLNLLGLMVHLDRVQLRITADPKGGLLGSLLCGARRPAPDHPARGSLTTARTLGEPAEQPAPPRASAGWAGTSDGTPNLSP